ncbi:MAG: hypothetical protein ACXWJM_06505 [Ramlibacter sp.]
MSAESSLPLWLFVSYGGGHVKALLPVAQRVRELGIARPLYLALTTAAAAVRQASIPSLGFRELLAADNERARRKGEELVKQLQVHAADREESIAYLGLSYTEMEDRLGVQAAAEQYERFGRQAFLPLAVLDRVIARYEPSLVVATNSPRAEQATIQAARARGVPSVCLVDLFGIWERDLLARSDYADAVCVLNEAVRDSLVGAGRPASDVHVTGNPAFDSVRDPVMVAEGTRLRRDAGWDGLRVCLYASSPEPNEIPGIAGRGDPDLPRRIESALIEAVRANPALALWVRRHPSEAPAEEVAQAGHPRIRVSAADMPLHASIHACDEVIVTVSTVGVEASLAGKQVTQVRGSILDHLSPYLAMGVAQRELAVDQVAAVYGSAAPQPASRQAHAPVSAASASAADCVARVLQSLQERRRGR